MKRKNYNRNKVNKTINLCDNNLLNRVKLVKGDLNIWLERFSEPELEEAIHSEKLKKEVKNVIDYMTEEFEPTSKKMFYTIMFNDRIPIYNKKILIKEIIEDSLDLITLISRKWDKEEKEKILDMLAYLRDNFVKIKLIVIALQGYFEQLDKQLDYYFKLQTAVISVADYVQEILEEYASQSLKNAIII